MSTNPKPSPTDCLNFNYPRQLVIRDRYVAEPVPGFGVCVYTIGSDAPLYCQCMAAFTNDLQADYVAHVTRMARSEGNDLPELRTKYPFFPAPDVLTMKCLIEEACNNWMDLCSRTRS